MCRYQPAFGELQHEMNIDVIGMEEYLVNPRPAGGIIPDPHCDVQCVPVNGRMQDIPVKLVVRVFDCLEYEGCHQSSENVVF